MPGGARHGASSFLYPFLAEGETDLERSSPTSRSVLMKAEEVSASADRRSPKRRELPEAARAARLRCGGKLLASGTAARPPTRWTSSPTSASRRTAGRRRALDLTEDSAILTALANDIGPEALFHAS